VIEYRPSSTSNPFSAVIIKALLQGVKDGNDILTLSLGGPGGWTESTASVVASRIAASGKIVTIAAGNEVCSWDTSAWDSISKLIRVLQELGMRPNRGLGLTLFQLVPLTSKCCELFYRHHLFFVHSTFVPLQSFLVSGVVHDPMIYYSFPPFPTTGSFPIYVTSNDTMVAADACSPLPSTTPDLSKYVTIIRRGTCSFVSLPIL